MTKEKENVIISIEKEKEILKMTRVYYLVGTDGYTTRCNTYASAVKQASADKRFSIETRYEEIEEGKAKPVSPMAKAMLEQFGVVSAKLKDKVVMA